MTSRHDAASGITLNRGPDWPLSGAPASSTAYALHNESVADLLPFRRARMNLLSPGDTALTRRVQRAHPGARALAAEQAEVQRTGYLAALTRQQNERLVSAGRLVPARITIALDLRGLEGPEVDAACGGEEPDVDMWELGLAVPAPEQVMKLAELTGF